MNILTSEPKPFLRWAGGKNWLVKHLPDLLPESFNRYYEPFLGGGAVYLFLKSNNLLKKKSTLSDINVSLIQSYKVLRDQPELLFSELTKYKNNESMYYASREKKFADPIKEAARFIYLNRTSFNGIYRENLKGQYNVPYGYKSYKKLFDFQNLEKFSETLRGVDLKVQDFEVSISKAKKGDLYFLDPPYTVAHENNGFVKYNQKIFSWEDQMRLKNALVTLNEKGAYFIITNAFHKSILDLYKNIGLIKKLERLSVIGGSKAKRGLYNELILTNVKQ